MVKFYQTVVFLLLITAVVSCNIISGTASYTVTVTTSPSEAGTVEPSSMEIEEGSVLTITATANEGWEFTDWTGDFSSSDNPVDVTVNDDMNITANFVDIRSEYAVGITLNDNIDEIELEFGQAGNPSDLSQEVPPSPPEPNFHAYFERGNKTYWKDYRANSSVEVLWDFHVLTSSNRTVTVSWQLSEGELRGPLILEEIRTGETYDMTRPQEITLNQETEFSIRYEFSDS